MEKCFTKLSPSSGVTSALFKVTFPHLKQTCFLSVRTRASSSCWTLYFPLMCLFVLVYMLFFFLYPPPPFSQGLWTEAHQCDSGAPEWQLPSAAGPWPVPRCLRRWCSPSAHCFFFFLCTVCGCECISHSMNRPTVAWLRPKAFKAHCMCGWGLSCTGR